MNNFLQKYQALRQSIPIPAVRVTDVSDCQFVDYTHYSQNCHYCWVVLHSQNVVHAGHCVGKDLGDCDFCTFCELCYESVGSSQCYQGIHLLDCVNCKNCSFCVRCVNCQDCFGCVALTHKQYCIFNKQLTKAKYFSQLKKLKGEKVEQNFKKLQKLIQKTPQPCSQQLSNQNCPYGDQIHHCKNVYWGFDSYYSDDSGYLYIAATQKNSWDISYGGAGKGTDLSARDFQLCYEIAGGANCYHCAFLEYSYHCRDCYWSANLNNCQDCFGCAGLNNKQFCVLNNQLTKQQYQQAEKEIRQSLGWPKIHE